MDGGTDRDVELPVSFSPSTGQIAICKAVLWLRFLFVSSHIASAWLDCFCSPCHPSTPCHAIQYCPARCRHILLPIDCSLIHFPAQPIPFLDIMDYVGQICHPNLSIHPATGIESASRYSYLFLLVSRWMLEHHIQVRPLMSRESHRPAAPPRPCPAPPLSGRPSKPEPGPPSIGGRPGGHWGMISSVQSGRIIWHPSPSIHTHVGPHPGRIYMEQSLAAGYLLLAHSLAPTHSRPTLSPHARLVWWPGPPSALCS